LAGKEEISSREGRDWGHFRWGGKRSRDASKGKEGPSDPTRGGREETLKKKKKCVCPKGVFRRKGGELTGSREKKKKRYKGDETKRGGGEK